MDKIPLTHYPIIPPEEQRCVWMTAGILSYQLCERRLECEECPLDVAMRMHLTQEKAEGKRGELRNIQENPTVLVPGYHYSINHWWILPLNKRRVRIGIEPGLAHLFPNPKDIVYLAPGQAVTTSTASLWVVMEGGTFSLPSPLPGRIIAANTDLSARPHSLVLPPSGETWLYELEIGEEALNEDAIMDITLASKRYSTDMQRFKESIHDALEKSPAAVGPTLADGGEPLTHLSEILGPQRYLFLLRQIFS